MVAGGTEESRERCFEAVAWQKREAKYVSSVLDGRKFFEARVVLVAMLVPIDKIHGRFLEGAYFKVVTVEKKSVHNGHPRRLLQDTTITERFSRERDMYTPHSKEKEFYLKATY
jgi:hypothetical protein